MKGDFSDPMATLTRRTPGAAPAHSARPTVRERARAIGVTPRALILGFLFTALTDLWIHWAELIMGGEQGHTAIASSSTPVGAFCILFALAGINLLCRHILPGLALRGQELLVVYVMITTSSTLSSSGQLHFLIPTVTAAFHYANDANGWAGTFHRFVPRWMAQTDPDTLHGFYAGQTTPPWHTWAPQMAVWIGFMLTLAFASLCIVSLLRRQWIDRERLSFPTVTLPLALMDEEVPIFRKPVFWIGCAIPFLFCVMNTLALNVPRIPLVSLRSDHSLTEYITTPPWSLMGNAGISFYPFVTGIAFLIPVDVTFSCWFFFWITRLENVAGAAWNIDAGQTGSTHATFPYLGHQGAGAFLALTLVSLWMARGYLKEVWAKVLGEPSTLDDSGEAMSYRTAFIGLVVSAAMMTGFCVAGGMQPIIAATLILLALINMVAATRIRAETGNAWLFGPDVDVGTMLTRTLGTGFLSPRDLTVFAFMRPAIGNWDMRCMVMPHQFDALKMAETEEVPRRPLLGAICAGTVFGLTLSFVIALILWHGFGAEAKTEPWRTSQGRVPFDNLVSLLRNPVGPDARGIGGIVFGFVVTAALMLLRTRFPWWPLHPIGYAIANTNTMSSTWMPFFLAWLIKSAMLRYGGSRLYRQALPFFLGLIAGDVLGGGLTTALGAFSGISVYPMNW